MILDAYNILSEPRNRHIFDHAWAVGDSVFSVPSSETDIPEQSEEPPMSPSPTNSDESDVDLGDISDVESDSSEGN